MSYSWSLLFSNFTFQQDRECLTALTLQPLISFVPHQE